MRIRLHNKLKPDNYTESCMVNVADGWRERNVWYPGAAWNALKGVTTVQGNKQERRLLTSSPTTGRGT